MSLMATLGIAEPVLYFLCFLSALPFISNAFQVFSPDSRQHYELLSACIACYSGQKEAISLG